MRAKTGITVGSYPLLVAAPQRRTVWFDGPIAVLPPRTPHISPALLALVDDEGAAPDALDPTEWAS